MSKKLVKTAPEGDVAISSRIRLARNIEAYPFTTRMTKAQSAELLSKVKDAVFDGEEAKNREFSFLELQSMNALDRQFLVEKHLISPEFAEGDISRAAIISKDGKISIMVNEEDHLRLQCIFPGMQTDEAWKLCSDIDAKLERKLEYAFDNCSKIGVAVRGAYGENSEASGNMFQISNQVTLGQTEEEIIAGIGNITSQISEQERLLRSELYGQNPLRLEDRIFRSYGVLRNARIISSEESLKLLSDVRLGIIMGFIGGLELEDLNEIMLMIQPAYLQKLSGGQLKPDERDQRRAELVRLKLKDSEQQGME